MIRTISRFKFSIINLNLHDHFSIYHRILRKSFDEHTEFKTFCEPRHLISDVRNWVVDVCLKKYLQPDSWFSNHCRMQFRIFSKSRIIINFIRFVNLNNFSFSIQSFSVWFINYFSTEFRKIESLIIFMRYESVINCFFVSILISSWGEEKPVVFAISRKVI